MNKRLGILMLAAGAMLLTACGKADSTADAKDSSANVNNVADNDTSVDCGEYDLEDLGHHNIWADQGAGGAVDCAEAYDVVGEYLRVPLDDRVPTPREAIRLAGGWTCDIEETEVASLFCYKGEGKDAAEFTFHTVPAQETDAPSEDKTTDCGEFNVEGVSHTVMADWLGADDTLVSCDDAFAVLAEYLRIPVEERATATTSIPLAGSWSCLSDNEGISCSKGETAEFTGMFHTFPAGGVLPIECGQVKLSDDITHTLVAKPGSAGLVDCADAMNVFDAYIAIPVEKRDTGVGFDNVQVADGWACGTYDGDSMSITCGKDKVHGKFDYYFQTEPV